MHGIEKLTNKCNDKEFSFFPQSFYSVVFESYEKLNLKLGFERIKHHTWILQIR